ncbi:hypothetical protein [Kitasatospora sp. P5_F3]
MGAVLAITFAALIPRSGVYDSARLVSPDEPRRPPLARLRVRRAALVAAEQWCTGLLVYVYVRLADSEEREVAAEFGPAWDAYAAHTPAFWPCLYRRSGPPGPAPSAGPPLADGVGLGEPWSIRERAGP